MREREAPDDRERRRGRGRSVLRLATVALMGYAVIEELRKPKEERTWQGALFGWVPYDLRPPTPARVKATLWAPEDQRLLLPRAFGVGWSPNVGRIVHLVRAKAGSSTS